MPRLETEHEIKCFLHGGAIRKAFGTQCRGGRSVRRKWKSDAGVLRRRMLCQAERRCRDVGYEGETEAFRESVPEGDRCDDCGTGSSRRGGRPAQTDWRDAVIVAASSTSVGVES